MLLTLSALALMASATLDGTRNLGRYIRLTLNGGAASFYKLENPNDNVTQPFSGVNFGIFDPFLGQSFTLTSRSSRR